MLIRGTYHPGEKPACTIIRYMKKISILILFVSILGISHNVFSQKTKIIYPEADFDSLAAKKQLALGKATIQGRAFTRPKTKLGYGAPLEKRIFANNAKITLIPVTPYFDAWYELRKKKGGKKTTVYMSDAAYRFRLETTTDEEGNFTFKEMKPGKYFLQAFIGWTTAHSRSVYTGSGYNNYGGRTDYYTPQSYYVDHNNRIEEFVEVKEDGEIVKVKLH